MPRHVGAHRAAVARRADAGPYRLPHHDLRLPRVRLRCDLRRDLGRASLGRYWGWDPKETVSFVAWVVYAAYLHARSTAGWRDRKAAWINVVGFVAMVFNLFFVNLVTVGLHSYAGVG
ncbi:cytochrome C assembly family protein [Mycobacterium xenopi 4042]|uniref:Cytochrome C assembly family protein n=1 Tax=Mycobacterium xenopi 4042 TaxID=1299334 RepID=X8C8L5_MYCXE|nr:cytochrome C assembly family protein [Mycobacterium xenopi 4042]